MAGIQFTVSYSFMYLYSQLSQERKLRLGWLPYPKAAKTKFSNTILPSFYGTFYPTCPDDKRFHMHFLQERNREFQSREVTEKCQKTLLFVESDNPASGGRFLQEGFNIKSSHDRYTCQQNMEKLEKIQQILLKEKSVIDEHDDTLFKVDGRHLRPGRATMHEFNKGQLEMIDEMVNAAQATHHRLDLALHRLKRIFPEEEPKKGRVKRVQKESQQKKKRRKEKRLNTNGEEILKTIAPDYSAGSLVTAEMMLSDMIASLTYNQGRYIYNLLQGPYISEEGKSKMIAGLNDSAKTGLQFAHRNFHKSCKGECEADDCPFEEKTASLFRSLGGQVYKTMYVPEQTGLPQLGLDELDLQTLEDLEDSTIELEALLKKGCFEESVAVLVREKLDGWF